MAAVSCDSVIIKKYLLTCVVDAVLTMFCVLCVFTGKRKPVLKLPKEVFEQPPPAAV